MDGATPARARRKRADRGLALVVVLWVGVVLTLIAGATLQLAQDDLALARNLRAQARAELAAEAGAQYAIYRLVSGDHADFPTDGRAYAWRWRGDDVSIVVSDEMGRVDLNAAAPDVVAAVFFAAGEDAATARRRAEAIVMRRNAAEAANDEGRAFSLVDELRLLPELPNDMFDRVATAFTVYTGALRPDARAAAPLVRAALERRRWSPADEERNEAPSGPLTDGLDSAARVVRLEIDVATLEGVRLRRDVVVGVEFAALGYRDGRAPYSIRYSGPRN